MRKKVILLFSIFSFGLFTSFMVHKFYMAIYQINYASEKKMLQITTRIFADDLDKAIEKKYNKKTFLGTEKESSESVELLKKYLSQKFTLQVNGQAKPMIFISKEMDGDVLVCYFKITDISKIKTIEIYNSVLTECFAEQQNIVHVLALDSKKSILFTESSTKQMLNY